MDTPSDLIPAAGLALIDHINWAQRCPADDGNTIEIRQIFGAEDFAIKK